MRGVCGDMWPLPQKNGGGRAGPRTCLFRASVLYLAWLRQQASHHPKARPLGPLLCGSQGWGQVSGSLRGGNVWKLGKGTSAGILRTLVGARGFETGSLRNSQAQGAGIALECILGRTSHSAKRLQIHLLRCQRQGEGWGKIRCQCLNSRPP